MIKKLLAMVVVLFTMAVIPASAMAATSSCPGNTAVKSTCYQTQLSKAECGKISSILPQLFNQGSPLACKGSTCNNTALSNNVSGCSQTSPASQSVNVGTSSCPYSR